MNISVLNKIKTFNINHHILSLVLISVLMAFLTGILSDQVTSFIYPMSTGSYYVNDPNMFYYMGKLFVSGYTPYYGFFDHKGPYIFYFTGLAHLLGGRFGMILLHTIVFGIFYYFLFKIYEEYKFKMSIKIIITALLMSVIIICGQNPSDSEIEYPFMIASVYFYIKSINSGDDKYFLYGNILTGVCAGIAIHLRMTEAIVPFGLVVYFGIRQLINKRYKNILINAVVCIGGVVIASLPPLIHSLCGGFTSIMYESIIFNNFAYAGGLVNSYSFETIMSRAFIVVSLLLIVISAIIFKRKNKFTFDEALFYFVSFIIILVLEYITSYYLHYLLIVFPLMFVYLGRVLSFINVNNVVSKICVSVSIVILITSSLIFPVMNHIVQINKDKAINEYIDTVIPYENKSGKLICYQSSASIYINNNILVDYPDFACQGNHIRFSKRYTLENLIKYVTESECEYVIVDNILGEDSFIYWLNKGGKYVKDNTNVEGKKYISIYKKVSD